EEHGESREEQEGQLDGSGHGLSGTGVGTGDHSEEPGKCHDRYNRVAKLAAKPDAFDDLLEEAVAVAEERAEEIVIRSNRLTREGGVRRPHTCGPGVGVVRGVCP